MKNSYLIAGVVILIVISAFVFTSKKTEAPLEQNTDENTLQNQNFSNLEDGVYKLNTESSKISWQGEYLAGIKEEGTVMLDSGEVVVENGVITSGQFVINMDTINSEPYKEKLVNHLKSDDFFSVETYPTGTFTFKSMTPSSEEGGKAGRFVINGDLTVKGITKSVPFLTTMSQDGDTITGTASFAINRANWEIKYNSATFFSDLGDKIIRDAVVIGLDLKAEKVIQ